MERNTESILKMIILIVLAVLLFGVTILEGYLDNLQGFIIAYFVIVLVACLMTVRVISTGQLSGLIL